MPRRKKKTISAADLKTFKVGDREIIAQAMKNGIIIRLDPVEYPIFIYPGAFALNPQEEKMKGSAAFDAKLFMKQNDLTTKVSKAKIRSELKKSLANMALTTALLDTGSFGFDGVKMSASDKTEARQYYTLLKKEIDDILDGQEGTERRDAALVKAYAKAVKDVAAYIPLVQKKYKKHKKEFDRLARLDPKSFPISGGRKKKKKKTTVVRKKLTAQEVQKQAAAYAKSTAKNRWPALVKKLGRVEASRVTKESKKSRYKTGSKAKTKMAKKRRTSGVSVRALKQAAQKYARSRSKTKWTSLLKKFGRTDAIKIAQFARSM